MKLLAVFFVSFILVACDSKVIWEDESYEVNWIDQENNLTLSRKLKDHSSTIGRVDAKVVAIGSNDNFVVAKREDPLSKELLYYYLSKKEDTDFLNKKEIVKGPFSEADYLTLKNELKLPDFSKSFE